MQLLVVEDDRLLAEAICTSVQGLFQTERAFDGEEGLFLAPWGYDRYIRTVRGMGYILAGQGDSPPPAIHN